MAEHEQVTITDEEIERDIAEVRASAATRENYDELLNEEARNYQPGIPGMGILSHVRYEDGAACQVRNRPAIMTIGCDYG